MKYSKFAKTFQPGSLQNCLKKGKKNYCLYFTRFDQNHIIKNISPGFVTEKLPSYYCQQKNHIFQ